MLKLFDELSFSERMRRMVAGLSAPRGSGEFKFAVLQLQRLSAPFLATVVPILTVGLLIVFGDLLGVPILPPYHALRLLPYIVPQIQGLRCSLLRERDMTDLCDQEIG